MYIYVMLFFSCWYAAATNTVESLAPVVTIYVHGSQNATKWLPKDIWYCQDGLHHIVDLPSSSVYVKDAQDLHEQSNGMLDKNHFYTFGWCGRINKVARQSAGLIFARDLEALVDKYYKQYKIYPEIYIFTHSHGGNVALHMLQQQTFLQEKQIKLYLGLIACPVQKTTEYLIDHPAITESFIIYSVADMLQIADFYEHEGRYYFPRRTFQTKSKNCKQVLVKINERSLCHVDLFHSVLRHIPTIIDRARNTIQGKTIVFIEDPHFRFYNLFNIHKAIAGIRLNTDA